MTEWLCKEQLAKFHDLSCNISSMQAIMQCAVVGSHQEAVDRRDRLKHHPLEYRRLLADFGPDSHFKLDFELSALGGLQT